MTDANLRSKWYQWPFLAHRRSLWKRASAFLCVSEYVRRRALKAGFPADKTHVHLNGLDCKIFTPKMPVGEKDSNLVLYVGRLIPYKGCDYLIRAMQTRTARPSRVSFSRYWGWQLPARPAGTCPVSRDQLHFPRRIEAGGGAFVAGESPGFLCTKRHDARTGKVKRSALSFLKRKRWGCRWSAFVTEVFLRRCVKG